MAWSDLFLDGHWLRPSRVISRIQRNRAAAVMSQESSACSELLTLFVY